MSTTRLARLFLCSTAVDFFAPVYTPDDGRGGFFQPVRQNASRYAALESRMLFDAAGAATFGEMQDQVDAHVTDSEAANFEDGTHEVLLAALQGVQLTEVYFVDSAVSDIDALVAGLEPGAEIHRLDDARDGMEQIASVLNGRSGISAIHILSHGSAGMLQLGSSQLTAASMVGEHADELGIIAASLTDNADILIYGCEFAAGEAGTEAVERLASITGADVAASDDITSGSELGGDWRLEAATGVIETNSLNVAGWSHSLALTNTGGWSVVGNTATNTTAGITTTITFSPTAGGSNVLNAVAQVLNATSGFFANGADGDPSLGFTYTWDTSAEPATGIPQPDASVDDAPMTVTISFSQPVTNPVINIDRLGGNGTFDPNTSVAGDEDSRSNSSTWTITTPGATLTKLAGVNHLDVTATTFQRTPNAVMATSGISGEASANALNSTAAGSIQVNGTFSTLTFVVSGIGVEGAGADGVEIGLSVNPPPVAQDDSFTVTEGGTLTGNLFANNGSGPDDDPQGDAFAVTAINGAAFVVGSPIALSNGSLTITNASTGAFVFVPNATYVGGESFDYTISDGAGATDTATAAVTIINVNDAPTGTDATLAVTEDQTYTFSFSDFGFADPDDTPANAFQSVTLTTLPTSGTLLLGGMPVLAGQVVPVGSIGSLTWTPPLNGNGSSLSSFNFQVTDNGGTANGGVATDPIANTITFDVTAVNDAPVLDNDGDNSSGQAGADHETTYTENAPSVSVVDTDVSITDVDSSTIEVATIRLTNAFAGDSLQVGIMPLGIAAAVDTVSVAGEIIVTLTGPASIADFELALQSVRYLSTSENPDATSRVIEISVNDGFADSNVGITTINVIPVNDNPTLDLDGNNSSGINAGNFQTFYTENAAGVSIGDTDVRIIDLDDSNVESVTVSLTNGRLGDLLNVGALPAGISLVGVAPGPLTADGPVTIQLTGSASLADYEAAIEAITFSSNRDDIDTTQRVVTVVVNDGLVNSNTARAFINIAPVNDAPAAVADVVTSPEDVVLTGAGPTGLLNNDTDVDGDALSVSGFTVDGDPTAYLPGDTANISGVGTLLINSDGSYTFTPDLNFNGTVPEVIYSIDDGQGGTSQSTFNIEVTPVNDAPVAVDDGPVAGVEDVNTTGNVITDAPGNDSDVDGDAITVTEFAVVGVGTFLAGDVATIPGVGTLVINSDGGYVFDPAPDYNGPVPSASYTITDGADFGTAVLSFADITDVNDAPVAQDDNEVITEDAGLTESVLSDNGNGSDSDVEADLLNVIAVNGAPITSGSTITLPSGALLTMNSGGSYSYDPHGQFEGLQSGETASDSFTYVISDGNGGTDSATVNIIIEGVNDAPVAQDDAHSSNEDAVLNASVLSDNGNGPDSDADGDTLTVSNVNGAPVTSGAVITLPSGALLTMSSNGSYSYNPNGAFDGLQLSETATDNFNYTIDDGQGGISTATVTITLAGVNDTPVEVAPRATQSATDGEVIVPLDVSGAFADVDGDDLDFAASGLPPGLNIDPETGVISGTIDADASLAGPYTVVVTATDPDGETVTTSFAWNVSNLPPVAADDAAAGGEDASLAGNLLTGVGNTVPASGTDADTAPDADALTVTSINGLPALVGVPMALTHGDLTVAADGSWSFVPNTTANALAQGEVVTEIVTYLVSDGQGGTDEATLTISIAGRNDDPVITPAVDQSADDGETVSPFDVGALFADPDGDVLSFAAVGLPPGLSIDPATGVITGTLSADASQGGPYAVTVTATDPNGNDYPVSFVWTVANPAPVAGDDPVVTDEDTAINIDVMGNDSDVDGDPLTVTSATDPAHGSVVINPDGSITYTPDPDFHGSDSFSYSISDGNGGTATATVTISVNPVNDAPVAVAIAAQTGNDADVVTLDVSGSFSDVDGDDTDYSATGLPPGLSIDPETGIITGTIDSAASQGGPYTVTITATDPSGARISTNFTWAVSNPTPFAADNAVVTDEDTAITIDVLGNDGDVDGDPLTVTSATDPAHGSVVINPNGSITYTPHPDFNGPDSFSYTISDSNGGTSTATVIVEVTPVNDTPVEVAPPATQSATDGEVIVPLDLSGAFADVDGDDLDFAASGLPPGLSIDPETGVISGTVDADASLAGPYTVFVTATDPDGETVTTSFTWNVSNLPPMAADDAAAGGEETVQTGTVLGNDTDAVPDGDVLTVISAEQNGVPLTLGVPFTTAGGGVLTLFADGNFSFDPGSSYNGLDAGDLASETITYSISDGQGGTDTATLVVTVNGNNDAPVVVDPTNPGTPDNPIPAPDPMNIIPDVTLTDGASPTSVDVSLYVIDPEGKPLAFAATGLPPGLSIDPVTGVISGTVESDASLAGPYLATITATDPGGLSVQTTVTYTVSNIPPVAVDDVSTGQEDTVQTGNVLTDATTGDADAAPDSDSLTVIAAQQGATAFVMGVPFTTAGGGVLTLLADGGYSFAPGTAYNGLAPGETAVEVITYTVSDGQGGTDTATLTLTVEGLNDAPVVVDPLNPGTADYPLPAVDPLNIIPDVATTDGATLPPLNVAAFVVDPEGEPLTFAASGLPAGLTIDPVTGVISGTLGPDASQAGPYLVTITATDPGGLSVQTTVTYAVANLAPVAVDDASAGEEDASQSGNVLTDPVSGDADAAPDGDPVMVTGIAGGTLGQPLALSLGSVTLKADGSWSFVPNAQANTLPVGSSATETVTYSISDGQGGTDSATLTITINGVNDAPVAHASPPEQTNNVGETVSLNLAPYFTDIDTGDVLAFTAVGLPPGLVIDPVTGLISGTLALNANEGGPYNIVVNVGDGHGGTASVSFDWDVKAQFRTDDAGPRLPEKIAAIAPGRAIVVEHPVLDTVNGLAHLGGSALVNDNVITQTVHALNGLNSAIDLYTGDGVISRLVAWAGEQGRSANWINDLFNAMEEDPYIGDTLDLALSLNGTDVFEIKSVGHNGAVYIGVDQLADHARVIGITAQDGGALPSNVVRLGAQDIVINLQPQMRWLELSIVGQLADGSRVTWNISVNPQSGEIIGGKGNGALVQEAELAQNLRALAAMTNKLVLNGTR